jgi:hypothetical protein
MCIINSNITIVGEPSGPARSLAAALPPETTVDRDVYNVIVEEYPLGVSTVYAKFNGSAPSGTYFMTLGDPETDADSEIEKALKASGYDINNYETVSFKLELYKEDDDEGTSYPETTNRNMTLISEIPADFESDNDDADYLLESKVQLLSAAPNGKIEKVPYILRNIDGTLFAEFMIDRWGYYAFVLSTADRSAYDGTDTLQHVYWQESGSPMYTDDSVTFFIKLSSTEFSHYDVVTQNWQYFPGTPLTSLPTVSVTVGGIETEHPITTYNTDTGVLELTIVKSNMPTDIKLRENRRVQLSFQNQVGENIGDWWDYYVEYQKFYPVKDMDSLIAAIGAGDTNIQIETRNFEGEYFEINRTGFRCNTAKISVGS